MSASRVIVRCPYPDHVDSKESTSLTTQAHGLEDGEALFYCHSTPADAEVRW